MSRKQHFVVMGTGAMLLLATLACNAPAISQTATAEPGSSPTQIPVDTASPEQPTTTPVDPAAICPQASDGTLAHVNQEAGFCFLYPDDLNPPSGGSPASNDSVGLYGPPFPPDSIEPAAVGLTVTYTGPAVYVSNSAEYASRWVDIYMEEFPEKPQPEPISVGGQEAVMMGKLPGRLDSRTVFVVANGHKYTISLSPDVGMIADLDPLAQETWDTVTGSIVFFEPTLVKEVIKSEDVCPQAADDTQLMVNQADGLCFLAPADAAIHPLFLTNGFQIGPTDTHPEFAEVRVSLVVGTFGLASGKTNPRDAVPGLLESGVDLSTVQDVTIGGKPAIAYLDTDPPWVHRLAVVIANDTVYTVTMNPYDEQQYPDMIPDADRLWDTTIGSLTFFTPFK
jgi:hypothetical protein